jgi:hypothetical protein
VRLVIGNDEVRDHMLAYKGLEHGGVQPVAAVLLRNNTSSGRCAVGLHVQIDGKNVFVKLTLDMLQTVAEVMRTGAIEQYGEGRAP